MLAPAVGLAPAGVSECGAIRAPGQFADLLAVVGCKRCQLTGFEVWSFRDPDIAYAA